MGVSGCVGGFGLQGKGGFRRKVYSDARITETTLRLAENYFGRSGEGSASFF